MICPGCSGMLGRDCFNTLECQEIAHQEDAYWRERLEEEEYLGALAQTTTRESEAQHA